jgi:predicted flap endonuclease-1-like 5' DNA nuclease
MPKLIVVEGIGNTYAKKLSKAGISSTQKLLKIATSPKGRKEIAAKTGISDHLILRWVMSADLTRVKGVGEEYTDLLEAAGVGTVRKLAQADPENLYQLMTKVNANKMLVRRLPGSRQVSKWVKQASQLSSVHGPGGGRPGSIKY